MCGKESTGGIISGYENRDEIDSSCFPSTDGSSFDDDDNEDCDSTYVGREKIKKEDIVKMQDDYHCPYCNYNLEQKRLKYYTEDWNTKIYLMLCGHCEKVYKIVYKLEHMIKMSESDSYKELFHLMKE